MNIKLFANSAKAVLIAFIVSFILLFIFNFISYGNTDPDKYLTLFAYISVYLGVFISGFISAKLNKKSGVLCGLVSGAIYLFVIFILSLIFGGNMEINFIKMLLLYSGVILSSVIGGFLGISRKTVSSVKPHTIPKNLYKSKK